MGEKGHLENLSGFGTYFLKSLSNNNNHIG
jgi:hypothetical protein